MLFVGGGNRKFYGYVVDKNGTIFLADNYPLFSNGDYYSNKMVFNDIYNYKNYLFLSLMEGGIGIVDAQTSGVLMYDATNETKKIFLYPDSYDPVKLITIGKFGGENEYNLVKFLTINGLSY